MVSTNEAIQMAESAELDLVCTFFSHLFFLFLEVVIY